MKENQNNDNQSKQILLSVLAVAILVVAVVGVSFAAFTYTGTGNKTNTITTGTISMNYSQDKPEINIENAMPIDDSIGKKFTASSLNDSTNAAGNIATGDYAGAFEFSVSASISGTATINYEVAAEKVDVSGDGTTAPKQLDDRYIKIYLEKNDGNGGTTFSPVSGAATTVPTFAATNSSAATSVGTPAGQMVLDSGTFTNTGGTATTKTTNYILRMWVSKDFDLGGTENAGKKFGYKIKVHVYGKGA